MSDYGTDQTDKAVKKLEKRLKQIYKDAEADIQRKMDDFTEKFKAKDAIHRQQVKDGKWTQEQYRNWVRGQAFQGDRWRAKQYQIAQTLAHTNSIALNMINEGKKDVFAFNSNYQAYSLEHGAGVNFGFDLYDATTVANLIAKQPDLLPMKKLDPDKDIPWNMKNITTQVTQGIIQGEDLKTIAQRIANVTGSTNMKAMIRSARTAMTGAQNAGRNIRLQDAKSMGINVMKEWMATLDGKTRDSHRDMDGEKIRVGDKWHHYKFSNGCEYPGDPAGPPREVYNCRCTLVGDLVDYPSYFERYDNIDGKPIDGMTYRQWENAKKGKGVNTIGKVYESTFKTVSDGKVHWTKLTKEQNYEFPNGEGGVYQKRDADVYTLDDGIRIVYASDNDIWKQDLSPEIIIQKLYEIPSNFRNVMQREIIVVDYENPQDPYWRARYKNFKKSYATGGDTITFYADTNHDPSYVRDTLCHEGGHHLDRYIAGSQYNPFSSSNDWTDATADDLALVGFGTVTPYGANALTEDFAESCMMLFSRDPAMMRRQFPNRTKVLEKLIKKYGKK